MNVFSTIFRELKFLLLFLYINFLIEIFKPVLLFSKQLSIILSSVNNSLHICFQYIYENVHYVLLGYESKEHHLTDIINHIGYSVDYVIFYEYIIYGLFFSNMYKNYFLDTH